MTNTIAILDSVTIKATAADSTCVQPVATLAEAQHLTALMRNNNIALSVNITKAMNLKVWEVLGYSTVAEWADKELGLTHSRVIQLWNIGDISNILRNTIALPEGWLLSDRQTRSIVSYGRAEFIAAAKAESGFTKDADENASKMNAVIARLIAEKTPTPPSTPYTPDPKPADVVESTVAPAIPVAEVIRLRFKVFVASRENLPELTDAVPADVKAEAEALLTKTITLLTNRINQLKNEEKED